jgi:hypothetical protein
MRYFMHFLQNRRFTAAIPDVKLTECQSEIATQK